MRLTPEQLKARSRRNLAIAGGLVGFILLVFISTVLNFQRNMDARASMEAHGQTPGTMAAPSSATAQP
jgi:hypothetical protein